MRFKVCPLFFHNFSTLGAHIFQIQQVKGFDLRADLKVNQAAWMQKVLGLAFSA